MKFIVSTKRVPLTESRKPCEEAEVQELTPLDFRDVKRLEDAKGKIWYNDWFAGGENHREEGGMVVCDKKVKVKQWVVAFNTLEDLIAFQNKHGDVVVSDSSPYKEAKNEIIIEGTKQNA